MSGEMNYDLVILGAGPGGYVAAIRASQLGLKSCVIEKDKAGGVCLNIGCIPSKSLINQANIYNKISNLEYMGISVDTKSLDYSKIFAKSRKAADTLSRGVEYLLKKNKVDLIHGFGVLKDKNTISVDGKEVTGKNIIIATGSSPKVIPGFEFDEEFVLSSTGALMMKELPRKMLIMGAGAIGVEFAYVLNSFGVEVVLIEMLDSILPLEDREAVAVLSRAFRKRGIKTLTSTKAISLDKKVENKETKVMLTVENAKGEREVVEGDKLLVVVGRTPNIKDIGMEKLGIETERGYVKVGDYYETSVKGVFAIGDLVPTPLLAHVAQKEGELVVEHIAGMDAKKRIDVLKIPSAVYCEPQIASFGYTEEKLKEKGINYKKASFPYRGAGKSVAIEETDGFVKVLYDPEIKEILGVHIVGAEATELIHELLLAESAELLPEDVATMVHAHPTLSEALMEAMRAVEGWAIHI